MSAAQLDAATREAVRAWLESSDLTTGPVVTAAVLTIPLSTLYALCREGRSPIEPIRCGRTLRFRSTDLRALVGLG